MLKERYNQLMASIDACAQQAGRDPASVQVIAVTKYATLEQMHEAYDLGMRHFGESRLQAALSKKSHFPSDVKWHFIGPLQSNKIEKIAVNFDYIHSVSSYEMAKMLAEKTEARPSLFLQVNTSKETSKQGFSEEELLADFERIQTLKLPFIGLMTMAPLTENVIEIKKCFQLLHALAKEVDLTELSMGMSQDFPIAIAEGATFLRIGSYLFK
jgi:pyridoxal phosphate enzyme (YggS family)